MGDFVVDTKGHCFLCLRPIPAATCSTQATYSLQYFSRYLKMDMGKVFSTNGPIPPDLLAEVEKAKLKAELCEGCAFMTERLSKLYRQLEKIEMEMTFYVNEVRHVLQVAETNRLKTPNESEFNGKLEIVNSLRIEAASKCSDKLDGRMAPQVNVQRQTKRQINDMRLKIKSRTPTNTLGVTHSSPGTLDLPNPMNEAYIVKLEPVDVNYNSSISMRMEDYENDYNDNELGSPEKSNIDLDSSSLSLAAIIVDQQPGAVPATPQSTVNPKTGKRKCNICSKEFSQSKSFAVHYRAVHLKIKYKCSLCSKTFTDKANHSKHFKSEHLGIRFKCELCGKTFAQKVQLKAHHKNTSCGKKQGL